MTLHKSSALVYQETCFSTLQSLMPGERTDLWCELRQRVHKDLEKLVKQLTRKPTSAACPRALLLLRCHSSPSTHLQFNPKLKNTETALWRASQYLGCLGPQPYKNLLPTQRAEWDLWWDVNQIKQNPIIDQTFHGFQRGIKHIPGVSEASLS